MQESSEYKYFELASAELKKKKKWWKNSILSTVYHLRGRYHNTRSNFFPIKRSYYGFVGWDVCTVLDHTPVPRETWGLQKYSRVAVFRPSYMSAETDLQSRPCVSFRKLRKTLQVTVASQLLASCAPPAETAVSWPASAREQRSSERQSRMCVK